MIWSKEYVSYDEEKVGLKFHMWTISVYLFKVFNKDWIDTSTRGFKVRIQQSMATEADKLAPVP